MQDKEELDAELRRRVSIMMTPVAVDPEYKTSVRPVFYEAAIWVGAAMLLWLAAVSLI